MTRKSTHSSSTSDDEELDLSLTERHVQLTSERIMQTQFAGICANWKVTLSQQKALLNVNDAMLADIVDRAATTLSVDTTLRMQQLNVLYNTIAKRLPVLQDRVFVHGKMPGVTTVTRLDWLVDSNSTVQFVERCNALLSQLTTTASLSAA